MTFWPFIFLNWGMAGSHRFNNRWATIASTRFHKTKSKAERIKAKISPVLFALILSFLKYFFSNFTLIKIIPLYVFLYNFFSFLYLGHKIKIIFFNIFLLYCLLYNSSYIESYPYVYLFMISPVKHFFSNQIFLF